MKCNDAPLTWGQETLQFPSVFKSDSISIFVQGAGDVIPGGATLYFDIELLDVEEGPQPVNVFKQIDSDSDNQLSREELSGYLKSQVRWRIQHCMFFWGNR